MALAVRTCILAFVADIASAFRVGQFDLCTVCRVGECQTLARVHFESWLAGRAVDVAGVCQGAATRSTVGGRGHTVAVGGGLLGVRAGVGQTHVHRLAGREARNALQALVTRLRGTIVDQV